MILDAMKADVERALTALKRRWFVDSIELTFIARLPGKADVVISNDRLDEVQAVIQRRREGSPDA